MIAKNEDLGNTTHTGYHEMPQKACERGFCYVIAFSQFFEMPHNRRISFAFEKIEHKKVGHFKKSARDEF